MGGFGEYPVCHCHSKDNFRGFMFSQVVQRHQLVQVGIPNHHSIAYSLSNISAKNYQTGLICVEVIVCNIRIVFATEYIFKNAKCRLNKDQYRTGVVSDMLLPSLQQ